MANNNLISGDFSGGQIGAVPQQNPEQKDLLQLLSGLLQNVGQVTNPAINAATNANPNIGAVKGLADLIGMSQQVGTAAGNASTIIPNKQDTKLDSFQQQRLDKMQGEIFKKDKENVKEALATGVSPTEVNQIAQEQVGIKAPQYNPQTGEGINPPSDIAKEQPQQEQPNQVMNVLKNLLGGFAQGAAWNMSPEMMKAKFKQEVELPAEIDKESAKTMGTLYTKQIERRDKFFEDINKPPSAESVKAMSLVESALTSIDQINNLLGIKLDNTTGKVSVENADLLRNPNFLNKNRQSLQRARDVYINSVLRRDSGAAIGEKELKDFSQFKGFNIGMKSFMQNPEVIAQAIMTSKQQLIRDRGRLSPNEQTRAFVAEARANGATNDEIYAALQSLGRV